MLEVAARQLGHPVMSLVLMKTGDGLIQWNYHSAGRSGAVMPVFVLPLSGTQSAPVQNIASFLCAGSIPADDFSDGTMAAQTNILFVQTAVADTG